MKVAVADDQGATRRPGTAAVGQQGVDRARHGYVQQGARGSRPSGGIRPVLRVGGQLVTDQPDDARVVQRGQEDADVTGQQRALVVGEPGLAELHPRNEAPTPERPRGAMRSQVPVDIRNSAVADVRAWWRVPLD